MITDIQLDLPNALMIALGPAATFILDGTAYVVGGALARISCKLPLGEDIDIITSHGNDDDCKIRDTLIDAGYTKVNTPSHQDHMFDFREKWAPPIDLAGMGALQIDILVLQHEFDAGMCMGATINSTSEYDCAVCQQVIGLNRDGILIWTRTTAARDAVYYRVPGWITIASNARQEKWNSLLPGITE